MLFSEARAQCEILQSMYQKMDSLYLGWFTQLYCMVICIYIYIIKFFQRYNASYKTFHILSDLKAN